jgi:hypothetical protein
MMWNLSDFLCVPCMKCIKSAYFWDDYVCVCVCVNLRHYLPDFKILHLGFIPKFVAKITFWFIAV